MSVTQPLSRFTTDLELVVDEDHSYRVPSPSIRVGAFIVEASTILERLQAYVEKGEEPPDDLKEAAARVQNPEAFGDSPEDQYRATLGSAYDEMVKDGMSFDVLRMATATVMVWVTSGREEAVAFWDAGGNPTNRKQRRAKKRSTSQRT